MITDPTAVFFVLAAVVATAVALERHTRVFGALGSALVGILIAMLLSNTGVLPGESAAYAFLGGPAVSAGIVLILLTVDVRSVMEAGPTMLAAFGVGAVGSAMGASISALLLADAIGPETWKLAGQYTATYTGGGVNFAAVGDALDTSPEVFAAGIAADVLMTAIWMATCLTVPIVFAGGGKRRRRLAGAAGTSTGRGSGVPATSREGGASRGEDSGSTPEDGGDEAPSLHRRLFESVAEVRLDDLGLMVVVVLGTLWASDRLGTRFAPIPGVLFLTAIALILAQVPSVRTLRGAGVAGNYLILIFLASNGAMSVIGNMAVIGPPIVYFALITVSVHGLVIFGAGSLLGLDLRTLAVASQANVGGPASAMALATARGYSDRLLPGVAVGLLGYAAGNYLGILVATAMRGVLGA